MKIMRILKVMKVMKIASPQKNTHQLLNPFFNKHFSIKFLQVPQMLYFEMKRDLVELKCLNVK